MVGSLTAAPAAAATQTATQQTTATQTPAAAQPPVQLAPAGSQPAAQTQTPSKWDYKSDPRWGKIPNGSKEQNKGKVWSTEQDIVEGYHELDQILEQKYKPTFKQMEDLQKKFKDSGIEFDKIDEYIKNYQTLTDPNAPTNQVLNLLRELADDDISAQELDLAVADLQEKKLQRKYAGLNADQRRAAMERDKEIAELKSWKNTIEQKELDKQSSETAAKNKEAIKALSSAKGFELTDQIFNDFLDHCMTKKVPTAYMVQEFRNQFDEALDKAFENKIKGSMLTSQADANKNKVILKPKVEPETGKRVTLEERLKNLVTPKPNK